MEYERENGVSESMKYIISSEKVVEAVYFNLKG